MLVIDYKTEKRIMKVLSADLSIDRKISKLTIMALKAFPNSPIQKAIQTAREDLAHGKLDTSFPQ